MCKPAYATADRDALRAARKLPTLPLKATHHACERAGTPPQSDRPATALSAAGPIVHSTTDVRIGGPMKRIFLHSVVAVLWLLLLAARTASAIVVTNLNDSGAGSLRAAIAAAAPGDTITFG